MLNLDTIKHFAIGAHTIVNQTYGNSFNYAFHLEWTAKNVEGFYDWKSMPFLGQDALATAWLHDIFDCHHVNYQKVLNLTSYEVAEAVFLLEEEKGRNRREKHSEKYFSDIANNDMALFVKLADMLANSSYCAYVKNKSMLRTYKEDFLILQATKRDWTVYTKILSKLAGVLSMNDASNGFILDEDIVNTIHSLSLKYKIS